MELFIILAVPLFLSVVSIFIKNPRKAGITTAAGYFVVLLFSMILAGRLAGGSISYFNFFYADGLSGFFILLISIIDFASSLYSIGYISNDVKDGTIPAKESPLYYALFNLFSFSMFFAASVNNLGILWVSIEMTTLTSAFLVGFYNQKHSIEAAWKYLIICSVGITLALLGTILFYYTVSTNAGIHSLNWSEIVSNASKLDPKILKVAFLFILVGYGTKAGIAPMHTWLPDAHSQALAPISALLSGVLLKTALYAIIRFVIILNKSSLAGYTGNLLVFFGLFSLAVSAVFVIVQKDIKRLLAYSSIEHVGVILVGLGIGGPLALFGAFFHMFNHAATKSLMFFGAGNIVNRYKTHDMHVIRGVGRAMPFTGFFTAIGAFALAGSPPFSIFFSEMMILISAFKKGWYFSTILFLLCLATVFGGIISHLSKVIFGKKPENIPVSGDTFSTKAAFIFLFVFAAFMGIYIPGYFSGILYSAIKVINGL